MEERKPAKCFPTWIYGPNGEAIVVQTQDEWENYPEYRDTPAAFKKEDGEIVEIDAPAPKTRRKRRTKAEIEAEKAEKEAKRLAEEEAKVAAEVAASDDAGDEPKEVGTIEEISNLEEVDDGTDGVGSNQG